MRSNLSLISIEKVLKISQEYFQETSHISTIRKWFLRVKIYELRRKREYRNNCIFIIDTIVELGSQRSFIKKI